MRLRWRMCFHIPVSGLRNANERTTTGMLSDIPSNSLDEIEIATPKEALAVTHENVSQTVGVDSSVHQHVLEVFTDEKCESQASDVSKEIRSGYGWGVIVGSWGRRYSRRFAPRLRADTRRGRVDPGKWTISGL